MFEQIAQFERIEARWEAARRRRKALLWGGAALLIVAVAVVEIYSFVRLSQVSSAPPLTNAQKVAIAQAHISFPIRQPNWLPDGAQLDTVNYDTGCAGCGGIQTVMLQYAEPLYGDAPWSYFELDESNRPGSIQMEYEDAQGHTQPMQDVASNMTINGHSVHVEQLSGDAPSGLLQAGVLSWQSDGIYYLLYTQENTANVPDLATLEHIVASL